MRAQAAKRIAYQTRGIEMLKAYVSGLEVIPGVILRDTRGQEWTFVSADAADANGESAKISVKDEFGRLRMFYATVFPGVKVIDS